MKPVYLTILTLILAGVVSYTTTKAVQPTASTSTTTEAKVKKSDESVYDRVMHTGKIRCGYFVWPPFFQIDPNTNKKSGIFYDITERLGETLELEIEWSTELNFGTYLQDLETGKYDAECTGGWPTATRGKFASYTNDLFYISLVPFVRVDDTRFDDDLSLINNPEIKVSVIDGENSQIIRRQEFSKSSEVSLPQTSSATDMMMNVKTGKADVTFTDLNTGAQFIEKNPNSLKPIGTNQPLKVIPQNFTIKSNEARFKDMLNTAFKQMILDKDIERVLKAYDKDKVLFNSVAKPYEVEK